MREAKGDLFNYPADAVCITTNGFVSNSNKAVMGRGCALEASQIFPDLKESLGYLLKTKGNHCHHILIREGTSLVSFPVKPVIKKYESKEDVVSWHREAEYTKGCYVPGFIAPADLEIIYRSCLELVDMANNWKWDSVILPRPGCGAGELDWETQVRPILLGILDNRFTILRK